MKGRAIILLFIIFFAHLTDSYTLTQSFQQLQQNNNNSTIPIDFKNLEKNQKRELIKHFFSFVDDYSDKNPIVIDEMANCLSDLSTNPIQKGSCEIKFLSNVFSFVKIFVEKFGEKTNSNNTKTFIGGTRPIPSYLSTKSITNFLSGSLIPSFAALIISVLVAITFVRVRKPRPNEWEPEKMFRVFSSFEKFWNVVSPLDSEAKNNWITILCVVGDRYVPGIVSGEELVEAKKVNNKVELEEEEEEEEEAQQVQEKEKILTKKIKNEIKKEEEETNQKIENSKIKSIGNEIEENDENDDFKFGISLLEIQETSELEIDEDRLRRNANYCWDGLIDSVLQLRHVRSWRTMVKRALKCLTILVLALGVLTVTNSILSTTGMVLCNEQELTNSVMKNEDDDCMVQHYLKICKVKCLIGESAGKYGYYMCHQSNDLTQQLMTKAKHWVAAIPC